LGILIGNSLNFQDVFGTGRYTGYVSESNTGQILTTGTNNTKGMFTGDNNNGAVTFFYIQNYWGNIREQMYDIPPPVRELTWKNRNIFMHLRCYMNSLKDTHLQMFPQASDIYVKMNFIIDFLTNHTVAIMRAKPITPDMRPDPATMKTTIQKQLCDIGQKTFGNIWPTVCAELMKIAFGSACKLQSDNLIGAFAAHIKENVRDQFRNVANILEYMRILQIE
jgi:hypothetical protein